jgi:hypothetical protein
MSSSSPEYLKKNRIAHFYSGGLQNSIARCTTFILSSCINSFELFQFRILRVSSQLLINHVKKLWGVFVLESRQTSWLKSVLDSPTPFRQRPASVSKQHIVSSSHTTHVYTSAIHSTLYKFFCLHSVEKLQNEELTVCSVTSVGVLSKICDIFFRHIKCQNSILELT